jgi:hypothetical protein
MAQIRKIGGRFGKISSGNMLLYKKIAKKGLKNTPFIA